MEVFKKTISAVFGGERRYVIPLFQRPYVWTREGQWEPLWEDIRERAELETGESQGDTPPHFLGAIVIQQRPSWGDELLAHDVIDGQQRLTTFQLLLSAFRDIAAASDKTVASSLTSWTRNSNPIHSPDIEQFKVWPSGRDVAQYRLVTTAGSKEAVEKAHPLVFKHKRPQPRPRMVEAYLFFSEKMGRWLEAGGPEKKGERLKVLRRVFDKRIQLVSIELEKQEDPQAIFETLNARGVPLLASDLLRNFVFQRAKDSKQAESLYKTYWERFEIPDVALAPDGARFWEVEERQGRLSRARLDLFVQHYLSMKRGTETSSGRLYVEYKEWITSKKTGFATLEDELRDFTAFAEHFRGLLRPSPDTVLGRFALRLRALDTSTVYPLVLGLLGHSALHAAEREAIFVDLESFLIRRLVCGRSTKNYNRLFPQLLRDFETKPPTRAAFRELLLAGTGEAVDWPGDDAFQKAWLSVEAYQDLKPARVDMILRAINGAMTTAATEAITIHGPLTVEHVIPQEWHAHWPLPTDIPLEEGEEKREAAIHKFGNLTLLTQSLNSSVSNGPSAQKLPEIALNSALCLNSYFQNRTTWTEKEVDDRGTTLFEVAKKVWPRP